MNPDLEKDPLAVTWEVTRACGARAGGGSPDPAELSLKEGRLLIDQVAEMDSPLLLLRGNDPLARPDMLELIGHAAAARLLVILAPSLSQGLTREALTAVRAAGCGRLQLRLDGSRPRIHDALRGEGAFDGSVAAFRWAREVGMPLHLVTTVTRRNLGDLPRIAECVEVLGAVLWNVRFPVPGEETIDSEDFISTDETEQTLTWLSDLAQQVCFDLRVTGAPFRRVLLQRQGTLASVANQAKGRLGRSMWLGPGGERAIPRDLGRWSSRGTTDGCGLAFISPEGDIQPSASLPVVAGNVRRDRLAEVYRHSPVFRALRDPSLWKGKCGACEYRYVCGGSRARAYAVTGDYLQSDPACPHVPGVLAGLGAG